MDEDASQIASPSPTDPFDRVYRQWAEHAVSRRQEPPSRDKWDAIVLRLLLSEDPDRVRRYRNVEAQADGSLGADAYELWSKLPDYTPARTIPKGEWPDFDAYEREHRGSMRLLMESQGLLERYNSIVEAPGTTALGSVDKDQVRRAQVNVLVIGCIGMSLIAFMVLTVLLIIGLRMVG